MWLALGIAALVAALGAWQGAPLGLVLEMGIALAVAAVPEALPAVATIALAVGVHRMARRRALVRRLPAVEALGSATVVCTDKTRTLTSGLMTLVRLWTAGRDVVVARRARSTRCSGHCGARSRAMASRPQPRVRGKREVHGDPVELALLTAAEKAGIDRAALVAERPQEGMVPFSSDRKFMASFHRQASGLIAYVEGRASQTARDERLDCDGERRAASRRERAKARAGGKRRDGR